MHFYVSNLNINDKLQVWFIEKERKLNIEQKRQIIQQREREKKKSILNQNDTINEIIKMRDWFVLIMIRANLVIKRIE